MAGYINDKDIFVRTRMGSKEIDNRHDALIPREARTLLILIDGQMTYAQVTELLEHRSLYKAGGVRQYMQILVDLEYVVRKSSEAAFNEPLSQTTALSESKALSESAALSPKKTVSQKKARKIKTSNKGLEEPNSHNEVVLVNKAKDQTLGGLNKRAESLTQSAKNKSRASSSAAAGLQNIISTLITKHAEPEQAYTYNQRLASCSDMRCIFELIQEMQRDATSDDFELALYLAALAFKKSKVSKPAQLSATQSRPLPELV